MPELDDDQLAALHQLRAAFGPIQIIKVITNPPTTRRQPGGGTGRADQGSTDGRPNRMTPEEHGEAHALLVKAVSDPDWQAARQALEELMGKLLVVHRLLEAEQCLAQGGAPAAPT